MLTYNGGGDEERQRGVKEGVGYGMHTKQLQRLGGIDARLDKGKEGEGGTEEVTKLLTPGSCSAYEAAIL